MALPLTKRGYTLVALIVAMAVMLILIAAVLPAASTASQRDKESELIFRGFQYAEGIRTFRRRYGRYPNTLKEMFEIRPRTLRKLWKDPMTNSLKWGLITQAGAPVSTTTGVPPGGGLGGGTAASPTPSVFASMVPTPTPGGLGGSPNQPPGPIMGVYSTMKKKGFQTFLGRENYNEWQFTEQTLMNTDSMPPAVPGPGIGGR
jgi:type II secretory pathway pseudopilin PulG